MSQSETVLKLRAILRDGTSSFVFHLLFAGLVTVLVFLHPPRLFSGDTDTARNYLNTIVSSLSTILALCISIILVAIQMTAGNYTHRVLDFFTRLPYNVSLFFLYLVTIMHSLFLMARIRDPLNEPLPTNLSREMSADLILVVICFLSLLLYMYAVVQLLKPERIVELIDREYHRAVARGRLDRALDSVDQICDIAKRASSFSDSLTGMHCLTVMSKIAARLPLPLGEEDPLLSIHKNIVDQWVEIVGVAVKERDSAVLTGVLTALSEQGTVYVSGESWRGAELVIRAFHQLASSHLLADGHVFYIESVAKRLYHLAALAVEEGSRGQTFALRTWRVALSIGEVASSAHPASVTIAMRGFLMFDEFTSTLCGLCKEEERTAAFVSYFEIWKAFVQNAALRDIAAWARWWDTTVSDEDELKQDGVIVAFLLAEHMKMQGITDTLCHVWGMEPCSINRRLFYALKPFGVALFDGWPIPRSRSVVID